MKLSVHVKPNAKNDVVEELDGVYVLRVRAPAVEGKANEAAARLLAKHFGVPKTRVRLVSGVVSRHKVFEID